MGKKEGMGGSLGRQLVKNQKVHRKGKKTVPVGEGYIHSADLQDGYDWGRMNLQSVTEESSYIDFLNTAEQARTEFDAEKWNVQLLDAQTRQVYIDTSNKSNNTKPKLPEDQDLTIPRRPNWTGLTPTELKDKENESFLDWRRELAKIQEETETIVTPYEKNLEFWRQLWRVIERSELVVQIVDCRNPLLFRSKDLEKYVKEVDGLKRNMILLNKADFLTLQQRKSWSKYLKENIGATKFAFFSAIQDDLEDIEEISEHDHKHLEEKFDDINLGNVEDENEGNVDKESMENDDTTGAGCSDATSEADTDLASEAELEEDEVCKVLTCSELMDLFRSFKRHDSELITVGFIGYPNVGKSSTINKLLNSKKVRVSETPGKTKHFQTLILSEDITLCDCPGLVMPSIVSSKAAMILNGILPVDQLRDHVPAVHLFLQYIPTHVLEYTYGLVLPQEPQILGVEQVLTAYAILRGFMAIGGRTDQSRAARIILKDFVAGKLLYCKAPPNIQQEEYHVYERKEGREWVSVEAKESEARRLQQQKKKPVQELDEKFFSVGSAGIHLKGKANPLTGRFSDKNKKKVKARITYKHLDPKHT